MMTHLATHGMRRLPALLLVGCLLMTSGVLTTGAPVRDGETDGMGAYGSTHAQVVRMPQLRPSTAGADPAVGVPAPGPAGPRSWMVRAAREDGSPVVAPRATPLLSPLSRAPPALS